jgi:SPP1 gp7 family putative phage head morphogenesis protein
VAVTARRKSADDLQAQLVVDVSSLHEAALRQLAPVLFEAQRELERDLRTFLNTIPSGDEKFTAQQYRRALLQIRGALAQVEHLDPALTAALQGTSDRAGKLATRHIEAQFLAQSQRFEGTISPIALNVAAILARGDKSLIPRHRSSARRYAGQVRDDIKRQLAVGMVKGETFHEMGRRIARLGGSMTAIRGNPGSPAEMAQRMAAALWLREQYRADRLVRTEAINAYSVHALNGIEEAEQYAPGLVKKWDAAADKRLCPACRELDGKTAKLTEEFPGGVAHPPLHPHCRCAVVADHADWHKPVPRRRPAPAAPPPVAVQPPTPIVTARPFAPSQKAAGSAITWPTWATTSTRSARRPAW